MKYGKNITLEKNTERFGNLNIIPNFAKTGHVPGRKDKEKKRKAKKRPMNKTKSIVAVMLTFFTMGFVDMIGIGSNYVQQDLALTDSQAGLMPSLLFFWFIYYAHLDEKYRWLGLALLGGGSGFTGFGRDRAGTGSSWGSGWGGGFGGGGFGGGGYGGGSFGGGGAGGGW